MRAGTLLLSGFIASAAMATGCVFPHRSTSLSPVSAERSTAFGAPEDVWQLTLVEAHVRPRKSGDLSWDEDDGLPDVYVRFIRDGETLFQTDVVDDSLNPRWNAVIEPNVRLTSSSRIRIEVWDQDIVGGDPVGIYDRARLPDSAVEGADARIMLEGGSWLTIRRSRPAAHRGLGISDYALHPDRLVVGEVLPYSPAARAGLQAGDEIVSIGEQSISDLSDGQAASALSMSVTRHSSITYERAGQSETVTLDRGFVWLSM